MSPVHEPFGDLAATYALGALDGEDLVRFRAHVAEGCEECERALADFGEALVLAAHDLSQRPPARVKRLLMDRLTRRRAVRRTPSRFWAGFRWVASVAIAAGIIGAVVAGYVSSLYEARIGRMAREAASLRQEIDQQRLALSLLRDPSARVVALRGLEPSPAARGRILWSERDGGLFVASALPPVPPGKAYALWAISGTTPIPAGLFTVDASGAGSVRVEPLTGGSPVDQFAVTLEPAAGVPAPTGPMYLASKV
jgi:anti-sigma-K factor RskA